MCIRDSLIADKTNEHLVKFEYWMLRYLTEQTDIPVPKVFGEVTKVSDPRADDPTSAGEVWTINKEYLTGIPGDKFLTSQEARNTNPDQHSQALNDLEALQSRVSVILNDQATFFRYLKSQQIPETEIETIMQGMNRHSNEADQQKQYILTENGWYLIDP